MISNVRFMSIVDGYIQVLHLTADCGDVAIAHGSAYGVFTVWPGGDTSPYEIECETDEQGRIWTLIQRRYGGDTNFNRTWSSYKEGFGALGYTTDFW